ncbi:MAG: NAD(P)H-hydrate dehydratase [Tissierellia bacterium]|nr:NAD(P)H-hydrate dehydratase [Tissierellia bacterium]MDD4780302.1 NAD(P)H-hydrate dehydratase [Tissierellia bacterium]
MNDIDKYILGTIDKVNLDEYKDINISLTTINNIKDIIKKRNRDSHKGTYGKIGFLSGSKGMAGASVLNLNAALRSGAGLVKAYITESIYYVVEAMSIEAITHTFDENNINFDDIKKELIDYSDVIGTGSGCANLNHYKDILNYLLVNFNKPIVIDAEGINLLEYNRIKGHKQDIILTPHFGEMARLLKKDVNYLRDNIIEKAIEFSNNFDVYLVLKGPRTVISCPNGNVYINTTGNPGMATAGSGDVLTGIITSFIGQKLNVVDALRSAVFIHGLAGDIGVQYLGEYSLVASDIIKFLPNAFNA